MLAGSKGSSSLASRERRECHAVKFIPYGGHVHASDETRALHSPVRRAQNRTCAKEVSIREPKLTVDTAL